MDKTTLDDLFELIKEMEIGTKDKTRTIEAITNKKVKEIVSQESKQAIDLGVTSSISTTVATSTLIGTIGGTGTGIVSTGLSTLGISALSATGGATAGATAGSVVPVVGTIVGAVVGIGIGVIVGEIVGEHIIKTNEQKKERLMQEVISKQNTIIRSLERELEDLKRKYGETIKQNDRYKYIIGILMANEELKKIA